MANWGSVPDYLPAMAIVAGVYALLRDRRQDRAIETDRNDRLERDRLAREEADRVAARQRRAEASLVFPYVTVNLNKEISPSDADVWVIVRNHGYLPAFRVELEISGEGHGPFRTFWHTLGPSGGSARRDWLPAGTFAHLDESLADRFEWKLEYTDGYNARWRRTSDGVIEELRPSTFTATAASTSAPEREADNNEL